MTEVAVDFLHHENEISSMSLKKTDESSYGMLIFSHVPFYSSSTQTSAATLTCKLEKLSSNDLFSSLIALICTSLMHPAAFAQCDTAPYWLQHVITTIPPADLNHSEQFLSLRLQ